MSKETLDHSPKSQANLLPSSGLETILSCFKIKSPSYTFIFLCMPSLEVCVVLFHNTINVLKMNLLVELLLYSQGICLFIYCWIRKDFK